MKQTVYAVWMNSEDHSEDYLQAGQLLCLMAVLYCHALHAGCQHMTIGAFQKRCSWHMLRHVLLVTNSCYKCATSVQMGRCIALLNLAISFALCLLSYRSIGKFHELATAHFAFWSSRTPPRGFISIVSKCRKDSQDNAFQQTVSAFPHSYGKRQSVKRCYPVIFCYFRTAST